jgi:hypothetical protein
MHTCFKSNNCLYLRTKCYETEEQQDPDDILNHDHSSYRSHDFNPLVPELNTHSDVQKIGIEMRSA